MKRSRKIGLWLIALLFVFGAFLCAPEAEAAGQSDDETQYQIVQVTAYQYYGLAFNMLDEINSHYRIDEWELSPLTMDKDLMEAAVLRATELAVYREKGVRPSGKPASSVNKKVCGEICFTGVVGDNVAPDDTDSWWWTSHEVVDHWWHWDADQEQLLDPKHVTAGIGAVRIHDNTYWVMLFGDKADTKATANKADYKTSGRTTKYPKIQVSRALLEDGSIQLTLKPQISTLAVGKTAKITLNLWPSEGGYYATLLNSKLKFMSSKSAVATVSDKGVITAVSPGTAYITVRSKFTNTAAPTPSLKRFKVVVKTNVSNGPEISTQPMDANVPLGMQASFHVYTRASGVKYQWYYRKTETGSWIAVSAASGKRNTYTLTVKERHDGYQYRCQLQNFSGTSYSKIVTLRLIPWIISSSADQVLSAGDTMELTVTAKGTNLSYQWYYAKPGDYTWIKTANASGKTPTYTIKVAQRHDGYQYRCVISNEAGEISTHWMKLTVQ